MIRTKHLILLITIMLGLVFHLPARAGSGDTSYLADKCKFIVYKHVACEISFDRLYVRPEYFSGKMIVVSGYLGVDRGMLSLYKSEYAYKHDQLDASILINIDHAQAKDILAKWGFKFITIMGKFNPNIDNRTRVGALVSVNYIYNVGLRPKSSENTKILFDARKPTTEN